MPMKHPLTLLGIGLLLGLGAWVVVSATLSGANTNSTQGKQASTTQGLAASSPLATSGTSTSAKTSAREYPYIEIVDSCGPYYQGTCVNMRSGPGTTYPVVLKLRTGVVLKVASTVTAADGTKWYKIAQDSEVRYPERIKSGWYVAARVSELFYDDGDHRLDPGHTPKTNKRIVVNLKTNTLTAYDGNTLFMQAKISPGLDSTPTPLGTFTVYKMTPSRYMQGPIEGVSDQYYDLPGVPWNLYFTKDGAVIHGAYWHDHFGQPWSHGCINLSPTNSKKLYLWAQVGMTVTVKA